MQMHRALIFFGFSFFCPSPGHVRVIVMLHCESWSFSPSYNGLITGNLDGSACTDVLCREASHLTAT